jgi:hypothetical protein
MAEYINKENIRLPKHKYFALHPDKIREGYYRGQTEEKDIEEKPLAPANIMINTRKKRDFTKSMNYHSTKKRNDYKTARVVKEALRQNELVDASDYEEFNMTNEEIIRLNERRMCLG